MAHCALWSGVTFWLQIPQAVKHIRSNEYQKRLFSNVDDTKVTDMTLALFVM